LGLGWFLVGQKSPQSLVILVLFYCFYFAFDFFAALQGGESDSTRFSQRNSEVFTTIFRFSLREITLKGRKAPGSGGFAVVV
jgi:hypothetical protein